MLPGEHVTPPLHALLVMELQSLEPLQEHLFAGARVSLSLLCWFKGEEHSGEQHCKTYFKSDTHCHISQTTA